MVMTSPSPSPPPPDGAVPVADAVSREARSPTPLSHREAYTTHGIVSEPPTPSGTETATAIKSEHGDNLEEMDMDMDTGMDASTASTASTATTLRPAPPPSQKRRDSEAAFDTPDADRRAKKRRKRGASPPWTFGMAELTTLKTTDGRRLSARVHLTPSDSESRARSLSLSHPDNTSRSRPQSPPWKHFAAQGPSSIQVDGKRKSGRVNRDLVDGPKRVSPRTKKLHDTRGADKQQHALAPLTPPAAKGRTMGGCGRKRDADATNAASIDQIDRPSTSSASAARIAELRAQIEALQPTRSFTTPTTNHSTPNARHDTAKHAPSPSPPFQRKSHRPDHASHSPERARSSPKIKLKINALRRVIPPPHPNARAPSPVLPPRLSIYQVIEELDLQETQQPYMESDRGPPDAEFFIDRAAKQAEEEGLMRKRLLKEAGPGGVLSKERLSLYQNEQQSEPSQPYGHHDHLVSHALYLRQLQVREKAQHRLVAKRIAYEALDKWKMKNGPTEEDLIAARHKIIELVKKQVVADVKAKWALVEAHVQGLKKRAFEMEQERLRAEKLQKKLEWSENLLAKQRGDADSDADMDEDSTGDVSESGDESQWDEQEENMTESGTDSDADLTGEAGEMDDEALAAYLAQRQAGPPSMVDDESAKSEDGDGEGEENAVTADAALEGETENIPRKASALEHTISNAVEAMNVDETPRRGSRRSQPLHAASPSAHDPEIEDHLSSDESTDMDSEDYDSDEDMSTTGDEADGNDEDDDSDDVGPAVMRKSLMALYSTKELLRDRDGSLPTPMTSVENGGEDENARPQSESRSEGQADAGAMEKHELVDGWPQTTHPADELPREITPVADPNDQLLYEQADADKDNQALEPTELPVARHLVPQPALLRGTLRSYQHAGLDWLASLYRNGTNGILADEMGLGKTIQTISLLAHLAEVHEVWESHLVIVPTSVILNWVTEFQKFLPGFRVLGYYGTAEERAYKRKGWTNDPHHESKEKRGYNVVITSYNVAMQDINAIRNVQWHYLILDEAHNIRNFNSQRWQVLIRLRTRARLLLTGTPLQNDLAEVWSLLTFLTAGDDNRSHGELEEFLAHWKDPVKEIFDQGVQKISDNAQRVVDQLHVSLRPFLLRRKKSEVEKDLPKKTESVVVCKLSKRQRQLYQDYMGLAETKATLAKGSGVQAGTVLLSLRRVCNHPDLFDPRPIQTSFAMEYSPLEGYSVKEQLVRQLFDVQETVAPRFLVVGRNQARRSAVQRSQRLAATNILQRQVEEIASASIDQHPDPATVAGARALQRLRKHERRLQQLRSSIQITSAALSEIPLYGSDLRELVTIHTDGPYLHSPRQQPSLKALHGWLPMSRQPHCLEHPSDWHLANSTKLQQNIATCSSYAERLQDVIIRFAFVPPAATVPMLDHAIPKQAQESIRSSSLYPINADFGHEARVRTSIAFPDKRLLIYDSGKLQRLTHLLRELQSRGSRSLIFTQMTGTLNVLEQFLSLLNLPYLRLDGSTPVERRQLYSAEFNRPDSKYQCMILSSRAGGVGLNLTGASSVIFYDLDWNPQMDRQCMDRAHRIGQVRDVEVYKMVSEKTVEENILRRANQKSLLDQTVIQDGHFTTEYGTKRSKDEGGDEVAAAIDRFLGGEEKTTQVLASVEDTEDVQAAQQAAKEERQDDVDFADRSSKGPSKANTPGPGVTEVGEMEEDRKGHVDLFMIKQMQYLLQDWRYVPPPVRRLDKTGRDPSHRPKKNRR